MTNKNKSRTNPGTEPAQDATKKRGGRVVHDDRGNALWEWEIATGVFSIDPEAHHVEKLTTATDLNLSDTQTLYRLGYGPAKAPDEPHDPGGNPYDSRGLPKRPPKKNAEVPFMYQNRARKPAVEATPPPAAEPEETGPANLWRRIKGLLNKD